MNQLAGTKHSGAEWMIRQGYTLSPLGVKVANVLGQVFLGIYHLSDYDLNRDPTWHCKDKVSVSVSRELATYDGHELTLLVFACEACGLSCDIEPHCGMVFSNNPNPYTVPTWEFESQDHFLDNHCPKRRIAQGMVKGYRECCYAFELQTAARIHKGDLTWGKLCDYVYLAHNMAIRIGIRSRSWASLEVWASKRDGSANSIFEDHASLGRAKEYLGKYLAIDFSAS